MTPNIEKEIHKHKFLVFFFLFSCVFLCFLVFSCVFLCFLVVDDTEINYGHVMCMVKVWGKRERQAVRVRLRDCHLCRLNEHF